TRLAQETSPYPLQHADNPVDWYPWGEAALDRARAEDRPILLSVGYSSCHWCHVMEHESFEDDETAALMNRHFVNVKVDREERPDIDQIYMKAVQAMTGRGGWPMTVFLRPDGAPFFGGTYYPPEPRHGMPSFRQVLEAVAEAWTERRDQVESGSARLRDALERSATAGAPRTVGLAVVDRACRALAQRYDHQHGGFGSAPKFPQPVTLELLLRQQLRTGEPRPLEMAVHTLRRMAAGGMRDHLAGGFHRYSVDARWLVPHFEKMLYDNALLASAYLDAYRVTGEDDLRAVAVETLEYLVEDMRDPAGGFYSARDADSEGEEGVFYVWTPAQVRELLGDDQADLFMRAYDVTEAGNFEGRSILNLPRELKAAADDEGMEPLELARRLEEARKRLLEARAEREPPFRDEKVLVAWNGLAIRAFAEAGATLGRDDFLQVAREAGRFLWDELRRDGRLLHTWSGGEAKIHAFLDDHASLGNAFLSLHGATLEAEWLEAAEWLGREILRRFKDSESGLLYDAPADGERLVVRPRDPTDSATPSGISMSAELFARLGRILGEEKWTRAAREAVEAEADMLEQAGPAFGRLLSVLDRLEAPPVEIAIVGRRAGDAEDGGGAAEGSPDAGDSEAPEEGAGGAEDDIRRARRPLDEPTRSLVRAAHADLLRNGVIVGTTAEPGGDRADRLELPVLEGRGLVDGQPAAYVCKAYACGLPAVTPEGLREQLQELTGEARS
ncbi:MAG: thioredoxin domain-containing protein, partial [Longimicrobiales bacterium]|nr:thioredoxin domain-containing protein [Longimicrobiales bacterium]